MQSTAEASWDPHKQTAISPADEEFEGASDADDECDFVEIETKGTLKETLELCNIGTTECENEGSLGTFGTQTVAEKMRVMGLNKRKKLTTPSQDKGKESVSEADSPDSLCGESIDANVLSESGSLMSGITTVSSEGSDNSNRVNKKLKFATTKEVHQFRVPEGSLQKGHESRKKEGRKRR